MIPFQWSIKLDSGEIYVVQAETSTELGLAIEEIKTKFLNKGAVVAEKATVAQPSESNDMSYCQEHKVQMKERTGQYGKFFSHSQGVYPDMEYCSGKGFNVR